MSANTRTRRFGKLIAAAVAVAGLGAVAVPAAIAQPYLGWDFGNGFGIGIGTPPSAYERCPNYGWPFYHAGAACGRAYRYRARAYAAPPPRPYAPPPPAYGPPPPR